MPPSVRSLALAGSVGLALSLLSALPVGAHGSAGSGLIEGALHPLTGIDHLLLLVGVGALAARIEFRLLLPAVLGAVVGSVFGALGGGIPAAELVAALAVSALGLLLLLARRLQAGELPQSSAGVVVGVAVAVHALLHGREASADPSWWIGTCLAALAVVGGSALVMRRAGSGVSRALAVLLGLSGLVLAFAPLT